MRGFPLRMTLPTLDEAELEASRERVTLSPPPPADFATDVRAVLDEIGAMLVAKNQAYGDSCLSPLRVFAKSDTLEQIRVRIDDKLSRLMRGSDAGEDTVGDLIGYLVMLKIAERRAGR